MNRWLSRFFYLLNPPPPRGGLAPRYFGPHYERERAPNHGRPVLRLALRGLCLCEACGHVPDATATPVVVFDLELANVAVGVCVVCLRKAVALAEGAPQPGAHA